MNVAGEAIDLFRGVFEAYPDGVLIVDGAGRVALANGEACALLGYRAEDLQALSVEDLVPDSVAPMHAHLRRGYERAPTRRPMGTHLDLTARRADGSEVMVEIALSPLHAYGHDFVVASLRGIGSYPRVKRAIQRAHYNEFVVTLGRVAVDTLDPDELLQRMPATVQQALEVDAVAVFLLTPNQLELRVASYSGLHAAEAPNIVHPNRPDSMIGHVVAQRSAVVIDDMANETRFEVPQRLIDAGAKSGIAVPLIDRGRIIGVLSTWSTHERIFGADELAFLESLATLLSTSLQRAQADAQLRHSQRLETVGQLTGGVAHDFNNLLTVIQGNLQLLADQPAVEGHALSRQLVAAAARAGQRGAELTGKLLAFSRRQSLAPEPVDPVAMLNALADMLRRTLGENIRVVAETPARCARCLVDALQLESALLNVAVNARDAMPTGGHITLRCGVGPAPGADFAGPLPLALDGSDAAVASDPAQPSVWLSVHDDGVGMPPEVLDRAFEPFFTTKAVGRGTGLGLSTVYGFVKQSHGQITIDSTPGSGTTVSLYFPAMDEHGAVASPGLPVATNLAPMHTGLRVLLVEDDDDVRRVADSFLHSLGCEVVACGDAAAALAELARGEKFGLLFSDIRLGAGIDGHELAHRAVALQSGIAVLLCSGFSRYLDGDPAGTPLRWPVVKKPYDREGLAQAIAACLAGRAG